MALRLTKTAKILTASGIVASVAALSLLMMPASGSQAAPGSNNLPPQSAAAYKQSLQSQVDTAEGKPQPGRDPGSQPQSGLVQTASKAQGNGARTDTPAAGVQGSNRPATKPSDVRKNPKETGVNAAGCYSDYGMGGEECLQAFLGADGSVTCEEVHERFPNGLMVMGTDRLKLDKNGDGTACGAND